MKAPEKKASENGHTRPHGMESLYPFLFKSAEQSDALTDDVRSSTREKVLEIVSIRDRLAVGMEGRLTECAHALALRFAKGGRLFAFGNGGSASGAQAVTRAFLDPSAGRPLRETSRWGCPRVETPRTSAAASPKLRAAGFSPWASPVTRADGWRRRIPSTICSWCRPSRCIGSRRPRRRCITSCGSSPSKP
jgi:hypothetical protein